MARTRSTPRSRPRPCAPDAPVCSRSPAAITASATAPSPRHAGAAGGPGARAVANAVAEVARIWDGAPTPIGAVLIEPVLGRGGVIVPPPGFLAAVGALARERGAVVIADEILTGLGRTGARWR